jgi:hypothetical protein
MADFIAVIRRAVDGLSDNTPEMRIKVYDRARSAVQRQLDNMKPRPADEVIARQMDKLDEAIATIERELSGSTFEPAPEPAAAEPVEPIHEAPLEAKSPEPVPAARHVEPEAPAAPEPEPEPVAESHPEPEATVEPEPEPETPATMPGEDDTMPPPEPEAPAWYDKRVDTPPPAPETDRVAEPAWALPRRSDADKAARHEPAPAQTPIPAWEPAVSDNPFHEPSEIFTPKAETRTEPGEPSGRSVAAELAATPRQESKSWWDDIDVPTGKSASTTAPAPAATSWDSFETFVGERSEPQVEPEAATRKPSRGRDGMSIGRTEPAAEKINDDARQPLKEERDSKGKLIAALSLAAIILVGAGYIGWRFSDNILAFVNGGSSATKQAANKSSATPGTQTPSKTPASTATKPVEKAATTPTQPVVTGPQKFTQRLLADGSEVDSGAQGENVAAATQGEGKSVAAQNEKATTPPASTPATPPAAGQTPPAAAQTQTAATPVKMFLYEERLGQASPTAVEGTVTWSVKTDDQGGHNEKLIQGDISVPGRKMSAIFALRRNNDPTLPASHIIELTFSLPKDFEGRGIESVLRISMKDKEQEQGDPLVAVPAKITDYFHMIALNSFPDAVKTNMDLLKNRDWIDIPLVYSNGRRSLLTLQKGPEGEKVFDDVIASWQASPGDIPVPTPAPAEPANSAPATPAPAQ